MHAFRFPFTAAAPFCRLRRRRQFSIHLTATVTRAFASSSKHSRTVRAPLNHLVTPRRTYHQFTSSPTLGFSVSKSRATDNSAMASSDRLGQFPQGSSVPVSPALVGGLDQLRDGRLNKVGWFFNFFSYSTCIK